MKSIITTVIFSVSVITAFSQNVGINTTGAAPDASAMLDIVSTNKGLLIPRVALTATNATGPITAPAASLLVYNTATAGVSPNNVTPGFYYWDGANWVRFTTGNAWMTTGNAGTVSGTNFVGTTDAQALDFRTNNTIRFRVNNGYQVFGLSGGTAALPFYSWSGDPNTGLFNPAADVVAVSANGAERIRATNTEVVVNESANAVNFRVEGATNANLFNTLSANSAVGFQRVPPAQSVGGATIVNDMYYPFEIGNDGGGALQATIGWYNGSDVIMVPETDWYGYVGNATRAWYRMYSYGYITVSSKEKKRNITPIVGNKELENYVMNSINNTQTYFYKYNDEQDNLNPDNYGKYRPMMHLGTILEESPDFLKDAGFSGIDNYAVATLALAGVKINSNEIKELSKNISDFGSVSITQNNIHVEFNDDFKKQLGNTIPVITVSSNVVSDVIIQSKSNSGFTVKISGEIPAHAYFDWIAMAKKTNSETISDIDPDLKKNLEVDEATKNQLKELYKQAPTISPAGK